MCEGSGREELDRCPQSLVSVDEARALASYQRLDAWGVLPSSGGWEDQTADFQWAVGVLGSERALIEKERPKKPPK